jgi:hypothetical protein
MEDSSTPSGPQAYFSLADKTILPLSLLKLCDLYHLMRFLGMAICCGKRGPEL